MVTIYGIKNCDTMKKAFTWLDTHHIEYHFHNYKTDGLTAENLQVLFDLLGWQTILNTKSATWRKLDEAVRKTVDNQATAKMVMLENPSMIKRPILVNNTKAIAGFSAEHYQQFFEN